MTVATADTIVRARVSADIKQRAGAALEAMGLTISDALRLLLVRVANEGRLPFELVAPRSAMPPSDFGDAAAQEETARAEAVKANWEEFLKGEPVDADFLSERPELFDFERIDKLFEGWE